MPNMTKCCLSSKWLGVAACLLLVSIVAGRGLWPKPVSSTYSGNELLLDAQYFRMASPSSGSTDVTADILKDAFQRYWYVCFKRSYNDYEKPSILRGNQETKASSLHVTELVVTLNSNSSTLDDTTSEKYTLKLSAPTSFLVADTVYGALRGLETFSQLLRPLENTTSNVMFTIPEGVISDSPRFAYRGLMIDTSRHYLPMSVLKSNLDAMAYSKLNVLHWHVVDSQAFPYVSTTFPKLSEKGAYREALVYTPTDVQEVIDYAQKRGIRVIPEFDTPGHSVSWGYGYPELITECSDGTRTGPMDPTNPYVYEFLSQLYEELRGVFPDPWVHLGGDEVGFACWENNTKIAAWMKERGWTDYAKLENYFVQKLINITAGKLEMQTIVWQEVFNNGIPLDPKKTIVEVWKGFDTGTMASATASGLQVILSGGWYLTHLPPPGHSNWEQFYLLDPQNFTGTAQQKSLVVGGEGAMWGEQVDATNFMSRVWPRMAAIAERLWSVNSDTQDVDDAYYRLSVHRCRLVERGIAAEPINPGFCESEYVPAYIPPWTTTRS